jgi:hypothetical protein
MASHLRAPLRRIGDAAPSRVRAPAAGGEAASPETLDPAHRPLPIFHVISLSWR